MRKSCVLFSLLLTIGALTHAKSQGQSKKTVSQLIAEQKARDRQAEKDRRQEAVETAAEYAHDPVASTLSEDFTSSASEALETVDQIHPGDTEVVGGDAATVSATELVKKAHSRGELVFWSMLQEFLRARLLNSIRVQLIRNSILNTDNGPPRTPEYRRSQDLIVQHIAAGEQACHQIITAALTTRRAPSSAAACYAATYRVRLY